MKDSLSFKLSKSIAVETLIHGLGREIYTKNNSSDACLIAWILEEVHEIINIPVQARKKYFTDMVHEDDELWEFLTLASLIYQINEVMHTDFLIKLRLNFLPEDRRSINDICTKMLTVPREVSYLYLKRKVSEAANREKLVGYPPVSAPNDMHQLMTQTIWYLRLWTHQC